MEDSLIQAIDWAVDRAEKKHPEGLGGNPYGVIMEEVQEAYDEWVGDNVDLEREELLDIIAPCIRRLKEIGL